MALSLPWLLSYQPNAPSPEPEMKCKRMHRPYQTTFPLAKSKDTAFMTLPERYDPPHPQVKHRDPAILIACIKDRVGWRGGKVECGER